MKKNIVVFILYLIFTGCTLTPLVAKGSKNGKIVILEQKYLSFGDRGDIPFEGVSDLAYDRRKKILYMIGDRGYLYIFYAKFSNKIDKLKYLKAYHIKTPNGKTIRPDIEGLTITPKGELISSFERYPRVKKLSKDGRLKLNYKIPKKLRSKYVYRHRNNMFESVAYHPKYGILTVAEYPINRQKKTNQTIYSLKGKEWHFKAEKYKNSAVTAIEVMDDGNILVLERAYSGLSHPLNITLKKVYIDRCDKKNRCPSEVLATFSSSEGWGYNNFEGLAKVGKNRYVMVSDNNGHSFISTVLMYFEIDE